MKADVINSFNDISQFEDKWDHNQHYEKLLLKEMTKPNGKALDIGCGTGEFDYKASQHLGHITGIDMSQGMIDQANKRYQGDNLTYILEDFDDLSTESQYDYIVSIATFHHLNLSSALDKIQKLLKPGGKLIVLDLYEQKGIVDLLITLIAMPYNIILKLLKNGFIKDSPEELKAWQDHSKLDTYMTFKQLKDTYYNKLNTQVKIKRLLLWRYLMVYEKPKK